MKVYGLFHGGHSYAMWQCNRDVEEFNSIKEAKDTLYERYHGWNSYYPCIDETATMWLVFDDPRNDEGPEGFLDIYPDRILTIGKRGGIKVEST